MAHRILLSAVVPAILVAACSTGDASVPGPKDSAGDPAAGGTSARGGPPTFHRDVEPLVQRSCQKCHQPGGLAPFSLLTYADAKPMAPRLTTETAARRMPPWNALDTDDCRPRLGWNHDERLSEADIDLFAKWQAAGALEGDPADAPSPLSAAAMAATELQNPTLTLTPKAPWTANGPNDQFRCFVLDAPTLEAGAYLSGAHVVPGNPTVVHHAVVFTDPGGVLAQRAGPDGSFECSSAQMTNAGLGAVALGGASSLTLDVWTPGILPVDLPPTIAMPISPGDKLIMQIHYSPGGRTNAPDLTKLQLRTTTTRPEYLLVTAAVGNFATESNGEGLLPGPDDPPSGPAFFIPSGVANHTEEMLATIPAKIPALFGSKVWVYGVMAHEHLAGVDVKVDLEKAGDAQCLLHDRWDFHWQRMYTYDSPVSGLPTLDPGDKLRVRCGYDNTLQNKRLAAEYKARGLPPMDIKLGEQTLDEMCLGIFQLLVKAPGDAACPALGSKASCQACCYAGHIEGAGRLVGELAQCECGSGPCQAQCATTLCRTPIATADAACQACALGNVASTCASVAVACSADPDCSAVLGCLSGCASLP